MKSVIGYFELVIIYTDQQLGEDGWSVRLKFIFIVVSSHSVTTTHHTARCQLVKHVNLLSVSHLSFRRTDVGTSLPLSWHTFGAQITQKSNFKLSQENTNYILTNGYFKPITAYWTSWKIISSTKLTAGLCHTSRRTASHLPKLQYVLRQKHRTIRATLDQMIHGTYIKFLRRISCMSSSTHTQ